MSDELLKDDEVKKIELADGKEYELAPLTLTTLAELEEELGCGLDGIADKFNTKMASTLRKFLYVLLKPNYPDMTLEQVGSLITIEKLREAIEVATEVVSSLNE